MVQYIHIFLHSPSQTKKKKGFFLGVKMVPYIHISGIYFFPKKRKKKNKTIEDSDETTNFVHQL
jgi:hypothetical protein